METLLSIFSLFGGAASGGLIGAVGGFISKVIDHRNEIAVAQVELEKYKLQTVHDQTMADKANDTLKIEIEGNLKQAGIEAASTFDQASFAALKSSYESDKASYATGAEAQNSSWFVAVDVCRGLTRPLLTWGLTVATFTITCYLLFILKEQLPILAAKEGMSLLVYVVHSIIFLASTAVSYWFASRTSSQAH